MPRKSKGARKEFMTRLPKGVADLVEVEARSRGLSYSEYIAITIAQAHDINVPMPPRKEPAPKQQQLAYGDPISA